MKILYVANERGSAQLAANAFRDLGLRLAWAGSLSAGLRWVQDNRDVIAIVVEAEVQNESCPPFVARVRGLGLTAPVIVVTPDGQGTPLAALRAGADDYVLDNGSLITNLHATADRLLRRAAAESTTEPLRVLYVGDAALVKQCLEIRPRPIEIVEGVRGPEGAFEVIPPDIPKGEALPFDVLLIEHDHPGIDAFATLKELAAWAVPVVLIVEWDEKLAVPAFKLGAADCVVKSADTFQALLFKLDRGTFTSAMREARAETELPDIELERRQRAALEARLQEAEVARRNAENRLALELTTHAAHMSERQAQYDAALSKAAEAHIAVEERHAGQLASRTAELTESLAEVTRARDTLVEQLREAAIALDQLKEQRASEADTVAQAVSDRGAFEQRFAEREAQHDQALAELVATRDGLQQKLAEAHAAVHQSEQQRATEAAAAADVLARRSAEFTATIADVARSRDTLAEQLTRAAATLEEAREVRIADAAAASERLRRREAELGATIDEARGISSTLAQKLTDAEAGLQLAAGRHRELEGRIARETDTRKAFEQKLAAAEATLKEADERHASDLAAAASHLAEREAQYETRLSHAASTTSALQQRVKDDEAALAKAEQHRTEVEAQLAQETTARQAADQKLRDAEVERQNTAERHQSELTTAAAAAAAALADRQGQHAAELADAGRARDALGQQLRDTEAALARVSQDRAAEAAAAADRQRDLEEQIARDAASRVALEHDLEETRLESGRARQRFLDETAAFEHQAREREAQFEERAARDRETAEAERRQLAAAHQELQQTLDRVRADYQDLARLSSEHAAERARLGNVVTERDAQLREQSTRHAAAEQAGRSALTQIEDQLRTVLESGSREVAKLQAELKALARELDITRSQRDTLRPDAERAPLLHSELEESRAEVRRQFEHAPYPICRWSRDGAVIQANRALVRLLGYRSADELRAVDFAAKVFESADDQRWLIDRCLGGGGKETVEATWRKKDTRRLAVRLYAVAIGPDAVEIVVEDFTQVRATEDKLRQAQRMEAVGRLASEVAVTCDNLLRDVSHDGQQWLDAIGSDTRLRQKGELLLSEVTRAASFLRQLAVYGEKQTSALEPVDVNQVLRDLHPVLKRVAGDDIEFVLPKTSRPVFVDVESERVERVLVNVASYARERMPVGGRLKVDLRTIVVESKFLAKYPNVRPGGHALITVMEEKVPRDETAEPAASRPASDKPGVDLGTLLGLVGDCGGHLWMAAEPSGNMVLKIHLPLRSSESVADQAAPVARPARGRAMSRWFGH